MYRLAYNQTGAPVVIDAQGHMLGGHEWAPADENAAAVQRAGELNQIVWVDTEPGPDAVGQARDAWARLQELNTTTEGEGA